MAHGAPLLGDALPAAPPAPTGPVTVQITHTYGRGFPYPVAVVQTAAAARAQALRQARTFFDLEDQYAVGSVAQDRAIRAALAAVVTGVVVLAAEDSISDLPDIGFRRWKFLGPLVRDFPGAFFVFERLGDGTTVGRGDVHSKLIVVDDEVAIVGSVNFSRRSWTHDSEIDAVIVDDNGPGVAAVPATWGAPRRLRVDLWTQHLRLPGAALGEPAIGLAAFRAVAAGVPGAATIRDADVAAPRFAPPPPLFTPPLLVPLLPQLLDAAWDIAEDPLG